MYTLKVKSTSYERLPGDETIVLTTYLADSTTGIPINLPNSSTTSIRYVTVLVPKSSLPISGYLAHLEGLAMAALRAEFDFSFSSSVEDGASTLALVATDVNNLLRGMLISGPGVDPICTVQTIASATTIDLSEPLSLSFTGNLIDPAISLLGTLVAASYTVTGLPSVTGISAGMAVSGTGLPSGCFVSAILSPSSVSLTQAALLSVSSTLSFSPTEDSDVASGLSPAVDDSFVGLTVENSNLPQNTLVSEVLTSSSILMSNRATGQETGGTLLMSGTGLLSASLDQSSIDLSSLAYVSSVINFNLL